MKGGCSELGTARADLEQGQAAMDPLMGLVHLTTVSRLGMGEASRASGWVSVRINISSTDRVEATRGSVCVGSYKTSVPISFETLINL